MDKFEQLYQALLVEYEILPSALKQQKVKILQNQNSKFKNELKKFKKANGVTRQNKCMRDIHDKKIQNRDNDVQTTAIEIEEENINELQGVVNIPKIVKVANQMIKEFPKLKDMIPSPLEIEQYSLDNKLNLNDKEIKYIHDEWENFVDGKIK